MRLSACSSVNDPYPSAYSLISAPFVFRDFLELTKNSVPTSRPAISLPPKSVINFVLTEKVPKCPDAGSGWRFYSTVLSPPPDLNNL
jgi:hypothetical protein